MYYIIYDIYRCYIIYHIEHIIYIKSLTLLGEYAGLGQTYLLFMFYYILYSIDIIWYHFTNHISSGSGRLILAQLSSAQLKSAQLSWAQLSSTQVSSAPPSSNREGRILDDTFCWWEILVFGEHFILGLILVLP